MKLADLAMEDVESYNRLLVEAGDSSSQVNKRLQVVKAVIDRAGRPEHVRQLVTLQPSEVLERKGTLIFANQHS